VRAARVVAKHFVLSRGDFVTSTLLDRRVLIVEDEFFVAQEMARLFRSVGARVFGPTPTAQAAMALAQEEQIDAAVLDIRLRDGDVYEFADFLSRNGIPFVFATGYDPATIPERFSHIKVHQKPVEAAKVAAALVDELPEQLEVSGEHLTYGIRRNGTAWRWFVRKNAKLIEQGSATSSVSARVAAFSAAMRRFH
jgi:CheY-like chemotaxis protein